MKNIGYYHISLAHKTAKWLDFVRVQTDYFDGFAVFSKTEHAYDFIKYYYNRDCVKNKQSSVDFFTLNENLYDEKMAHMISIYLNADCLWTDLERFNQIFLGIREVN